LAQAETARLAASRINFLMLPPKTELRLQVDHALSAVLNEYPFGMDDSPIRKHTHFMPAVPYGKAQLTVVGCRSFVADLEDSTRRRLEQNDGRGARAPRNA